MQWFNAHVTVDRVFGDHVDELLDRLEGFHPAPSAWSDGRLSARISLSAGSMIDAAAQAHSPCSRRRPEPNRWRSS